MWKPGLVTDKRGTRGGRVGFESWIKKHGWYSKQDICFFFKESARGCQAVMCWYPFLKTHVKDLTCQGVPSWNEDLLRGCDIPLLYINGTDTWEPREVRACRATLGITEMTLFFFFFYLHELHRDSQCFSRTQTIGCINGKSQSCLAVSGWSRCQWNSSFSSQPVCGINCTPWQLTPEQMVSWKVLIFQSRLVLGLNRSY